MQVNVIRVLCRATEFPIVNKRIGFAKCRRHKYKKIIGINMNNTIILYEDVEFKNHMIDVQVEQSNNNMNIKDVFENKTDNLITNNFSRSDLDVITEIMKFDLGYI